MWKDRGMLEVENSIDEFGRSWLEERERERENEFGKLLLLLI